MAGRGWKRGRAWCCWSCLRQLVTSGEEKEATPEKEPGRLFNSKLRFSVWAQVEDGKFPRTLVRRRARGLLQSLHATGGEWRPWAGSTWGRCSGNSMSRVYRDCNSPIVHRMTILAHLKELRGLRSLDFSCSPVTDDGLAHLRELKGLQSLILGGARVTDAGLAYLKELKGLQELGLGVRKSRETALLTWRS